MKHYLDLIPISAKIHRKQSMMTRICIVLAVSLITVIFGMADMAVRGQKIQALQKYGGWHAGFESISEEQAALISARPDVVSASWYAVTNYRLDMHYSIGEKETVICGLDESMSDIFPFALEEGRFPAAPNEAIAAASLKRQLGIKAGDTVELKTPDNRSLLFTITGFIRDSSMLNDSDAFGIFLDTDTYRVHFSDITDTADLVYYVCFTPFCNIQKSIHDIQSQFALEDTRVTQNTMLLGLMLQSTDSFMLLLYLTACVLAVLVAAAGVFMIAGSLNSNISKRTEFFGMLRCLGASKKQIKRFVKREALSWCKTAISLGCAVGTLVIWALCNLLKALTPTYFASLPAFGISWIGIIGGILLGIFTVLWAARSPAAKAAKVSPLTAVSGNADTSAPIRKTANTNMLHIDTALGIHHAVGNRKSLFLTAGSFAFSIILFLSFSTFIDFMNHAVNPLKPYAPDLSIFKTDHSSSIPASLAEDLAADPAVKRVYGRSFVFNLPMTTDSGTINTDLISYEDYQLNWAEDMLLEGDMESAANGGGVLTVFHPDNTLTCGSSLTIDTPSGPRQIAVTGVLSSCPFNRSENTEIIICREDLFRELTGQGDYTIIDIQLTPDADDTAVDKIRAAAGSDVLFSDRRMSNSEARGAYYSSAIFVYGFLAVIAFISIFNIMNTVAMSVSARMKQYGAMRAIGMSCRQLQRMVAAETASYTFFGIVIGCACGLPLNRFLFYNLVTFRWGDPWYLPVGALSVILLLVILSVLSAVRAPFRSIRRLSVIDTISAD